MTRWDSYQAFPELEGAVVFVEDLGVSGTILCASAVGTREAELTITVNSSKGTTRYVLRRHLGKIKRWMRLYHEKKTLGR